MKFFKIAVFTFLITILSTSLSFASEKSSITPEEALNKLLEGNQHFIKNEMTHPDESFERRSELKKGQHPFVVILSCSDSRVPPEIIFDQGLGDIFEVRVAGNVLDDKIIGSIEYAVEHTGAPLIMVLGHENCGAVEAAVKHVKEAHITSILKEIEPAVKMARHQQGDVLDNAVRNNVFLVVDALKNSNPIISKHIKNGDVKIVGAYYDLDTGRVEIIK